MSDIFELGTTFLFDSERNLFISTFWAIIIVELLRTFIGTFFSILHQFSGDKMDVAKLRVKGGFKAVKGVTFILASHNTDRGVLQTVRSIHNQTIKNIQIIVVNDGSNDKTHEYCCMLVRKKEIHNYIKLETRTGRAAALNAGLPLAKYPVVVMCDTGTTFHTDTVEIALGYFEDPRVAAVATPVGVRNYTHTLICYLQKINYFLSCTLSKNLLHFIGFPFNVSGACGIFRADVLKSIGGLFPSSGEDYETTLALLNLGWKVSFSPNSVALTDVPETLTALIKQRLRWDRDQIHLLHQKFSHFFLNPFLSKFNITMALGIIDAYILEFLFPFIIYLYLGFFIFIYGETFIYLSIFIYLISLLIFIIHLSIGLLFVNHADRDWKMLIYSPLYLLFQFFVLLPIRLWAYASELANQSSLNDAYVPIKVRKVLRRKR